MKCRCGAEIDLSSAYCALCGTRRPFAWICERCSREVPWDHPTNLVCSTVCPSCGDPKPASPPSLVILRALAVIPNCSPFAQFVLLLGAIASLLGCIATAVMAVGFLFEGLWVPALIACPFSFLMQAGVFVVFLRVRALGREP